ncbi:coiled-coil domain-containing protein 152 isoform X4 [Lethenteron reissneri]|uniref:coiled-coil domain-containing protein 152 isoform X4 n=1 Tax=Lethenteron reissneri TaxID=7753 RepID=UPI002AB6E4F3|nr:coiled-coil domain-containing protein 152 isoform X4 [Lethenteron reissneri]
MARLLEEFEAWEEYVCAAERSNSTLKRRLQEAEWRLSASQATESQLREEENEALKQRGREMDLGLVELQTCHDEELRRLDTERLVRQEKHSLLLASTQQEAERRVAEEAGRLQEVIGQGQQEVETLARRLSDVEKQKGAKLLKLQVEYDTKIVKLQSVALLSKQRSSGASDHDIFRQKLQHLQASKDQEIAALQRQVKQLEHRLHMEQDSLPKRRRL